MPEHLRSETDPIDPSQHDEAPPSLLRHRMPARAALLAGLTCLGLALSVGAGWASNRSSAIVDVSQPTKTVVPHAVAVSTSTPLPFAPRPTLHAAPSIPYAPTAVSEPTLNSTEALSPAVANLLSMARAAYQEALVTRSITEAQRAVDLLAQVEAADPAAAGEAGGLASQAAYALDALSSTVYLTPQNRMRWQLTDASGKPLTYPIDLTIDGKSLYVVDSGSLYVADLAALPAGGGRLAMTAVLTPSMRIEGFPVKEIVAADATHTVDAVFVLDKSNDIYRYQPSIGRWSLELPVAREYQNPDPFYQNLATYDNRVYLLDPARNQIWRHPAAEPQYLPPKLPWLLDPGDPDVSSGIDLAIDGAIYVLSRDGSIAVYTPAPLAHYTLSAADGRSHVAGLGDTQPRPVAIAVSVDGVRLYVVDPGRRRVVALDRRDGRMLSQYVAADDPDFAHLHAVAERDGTLYALVASRLVGIDLSKAISATLPLTGQLPTLASLPEMDNAALQPGVMAPNDPGLPSIIASYGFTMPIRTAMLPDRGAIYPGSRRAYRYGVHEGLDIYGKDVGVNLTVGTTVMAAADGVVERADLAYQELSPAALNALLADAHARHDTPRDALDTLSGRQVRIDHGGGLMTTYAHLSSIAEEIAVGQPVQAGQIIGTVGVSGTPDGAAGITQFAHLHFEIRIGDQHQYYLGQWLSVEETRRAYERIFRVPVRPAFLEYRNSQ